MAAIERLAIPLFGVGEQAAVPFLSTVDRVNAYVEPLATGRQSFALIGMPGMKVFTAYGAQPARAALVREGELDVYLIAGDSLFRLNPSLSIITLGAFPTSSGAAWIADGGDQLFVNDGVKAYVYTRSTQTIAPVTDPNYPIRARGGMFAMGRFWVYRDDRVYASNVYNGLTWNALDFFTAEAAHDGVVSVASIGNQLVVFGQRSVEWWGPTSASDLPGALGYRPVTSAVVDIGLAAERGWAIVNGRLLFLARSVGSDMIAEVVPYRVELVRAPQIETWLAQTSIHHDAVATSYTINGHPFWQVTFPHGGTWVLDVSMMLWSRRISDRRPFFRGWLALASQGRLLFCDAFDGIIWEVDGTRQHEGDDPLIFEVTSHHLLSGGKMVTLSSVQVDVETGIGETGDPVAMIQLSKDGGRTWGHEAFVPLGQIGQYRRRATRWRCGSARDLAVRLRITDPVPRRVCGAYVMVRY